MMKREKIMKKKSLVLALAMLALVGCDTKKDDTKEVKDDARPKTQTTSKAEEKELSYSEQIAKNLEENKKKPEKELAEAKTNNPTIDEIISKEPTINVENFSDKLILNAYKNPNSMYEQYLSDSMTWYEVPEDQVINALKSMISEGVKLSQELGITLDSLPIYYAIDKEAYKVREDVYSRGKASCMKGFDINGMYIDNFNAFLDPNIANDYRLMRSTYELRDYLVRCYAKSIGLGEPLGKWFLSYSGSIDNMLDPENYPGGITAATLITTSYDPYPCYVTIIDETNNPVKVGYSLNQIWVMPINLFTLDASTPNRIDMLPVPHMITGPGFMYLN